MAFFLNFIDSNGKLMWKGGKGEFDNSPLLHFRLLSSK